MDKFTKVRNIGKGNMGACALARNNEDGKYYVIKQVDLTRMNKKERQQSLNEARVLSSLRHPNVINYVDSFLAKKSDHLCIVMEFADGGDISSRIKKNYGVNFRESQVLDWFIQLVLSLHYVHQRKILHRDVKTQNVFLTSDNVVKLGDFGIARTLSNTYDQAKTFVGTPYYLSPELILERPYDHRSDVWALGVVLYELLTLKHPFNASDMKGLMQRILKVQYDPIQMIYSAEVRNIVPRLLMKDPAQRIELGDVLKLPVVQRRIMEWLRGDVVPQKYIDALLKQKLLPSELLEKAPASQDDQSRARGTHDAASPQGEANAKHKSSVGTDGDSDDSESGHTNTNATEPILPPLSTRRHSPSSGVSGEVRTAPPTAYTPPPGSRVQQYDRVSRGLTPTTSPHSQRSQPQQQQYHQQDRGEVPVRRVSRQVSQVSVAGAGRHQRVSAQKYFKTPSSNVNVAPPLYSALNHRSHPPATSSSLARPSPLPPRLVSLDNFYQQLNYYQQQQRSGGGGGGAITNNHVAGNNYGSSRHPSAAAGGCQTPPLPYSACGVSTSGANAPAHIPVTVLSSRRAARKRSDIPSQKAAPSAHVNPLFRPSNNNSNGNSNIGFSGAGAVGSNASAPTDAANVPDIKAMLQRAARERAQRRLGGISQLN